ncbi:MAG: hypothetical protein ABRQ26_04270 [Syntrophomonadaceae bacterium]
MENIVLVAPRPGAGVNTIALNLGIGLTHYKTRVLLSSGYTRLSDWLGSPGNRENSLLERNPIFNWRLLSGDFYSDATVNDTFDYRLYVPTDKEWLDGFLMKYPALVLCVIDGNKPDLPGIMALNRHLNDARPDGKGIDLVVPNKIKPGEWSENSQLIFDLAEDLGWEKIVDPVPHCEALHDLPKEHTSVWELPAQYNNRRAAFQSLVDRVVETG